MENEIWEDVPDYSEYYKVSNKGRIKSFHCINGRVSTNGAIREPFYSKGMSYPGVSLTKNKKYTHISIHILLCRVFIPNPNKYKYINHIDGNKLNYSLENLEWCTSGQNQKHAYDTGLKRKLTGTQNGRNKLTEAEALFIYNSKDKGYLLAAKFNVDKSVIQNIRTGKIWGTITGKKYEKKYFSPLTPEKIIEIYTSKLSAYKEAKIYGVTPSTLWCIKSGRTYRTITQNLHK